MQSACVDMQARVVSRWAGSDSPGRLICNQPCPGSSPGTGFQRLTTIHCPICTDNHSPYQLENHSYIAGMHNERARCQGTADGCDRIANTRVKSRSHIYINYDVTLTIRAERARKRGEARSAPIQVVNNVTSRGCCRALKAPALCVNSFFDALVSLNKPGGHAPLGENCSSNRRITPSWDFPLQHNSERRNPYASLQRRGEKITIPSGGIGRRMLSCGEDQTPAKATIQHNWRGVWSCGVQIPASVSKDNHAASCPRQSGRVRDALALLCGASSHKYLHGAGLPNFHHLPKSPPHSLVNY